ncbi:MAG TPA: LPS assembly lipoprotein LptE [Vicinamibacterales bacterium]|jgi:hypothetical protein|nr:LPS assembly lipoprotein LptE [Vicinamibacterales bacterium]
MTHRTLPLSIALLLSSFLLAGCGYTLAGHGSFLPAYIHQIGVPTFTNRTPIFNLETVLTQKVRGEFIGRGKYKILPENTGVDAVLNGEIVSVIITPTSFGNTPQIPGAPANSSLTLATRYSIAMTARIELRDLRENKVLWENAAVQTRQDYEATSGNKNTDPGAFFQQDVGALERMSTEFARTIVSAILEAF